MPPRPLCFPVHLFLTVVVLAPLAAPLVAADTSAPAPIMMKAAELVPWTNQHELEAFAARGHPGACAQLGEQLLRGDGTTQNIPRALSLLEQAARSGIGPAAFRLGMVYDEGQGVTRDRLRALDYFRAAAAAGEAEGFFNVGAAYVGAHGVKRDYTEGLAWIILAAKRGAGGDTEQTVRDRILKLRRPEWIAAAEARAPLIERELAAAKPASFLPAPASAPATTLAPTPASPPAATQIPTPDRPEIIRPTLTNAPFAPSDVLPPPLPLPDLSKPAPAVPSGPPVNLVLPTGRRANFPDFAALERAADRGDPVAAAGLGRLLLEGQVTPADPTRAVIVLERAAQVPGPTSADAAHLLAEVYTRGTAAPRDEKRAFAYNLQAARGGSLQCIFNVGALYANGTGTARDYTSALAWLIVAKNYGVDRGDSATRIRTYLQKNAPAEIAVAEKRATALIAEIELTRSR